MPHLFRLVQPSDRTARRELTDGWEATVAVASEPPHLPESLAASAAAWFAAPVPGTVAGALRKEGKLDLERPPFRFDGTAFWYRLRFSAVAEACGSSPRLRQVLVCEGLATVAEVWLNGASLGRTDNMFRSYRWDVSGQLLPENELLMRFEALDKVLAARRPRPRWRVPMIEHQQLRYVRTTLLGRTPGWSPPLAAVGPWRGVALEEPSTSPHDVRLRTQVATSGAGSPAEGVLALSLSWTPPEGTEVAVLRAELARGDARVVAELVRTGEASEARFVGELRLPDVALWWPFTHGTPALHDLTLTATLASAGAAATEMRWVGPRVGFRSVHTETAHEDASGIGFALSINGTPVFARGACWTPPDPVMLQASPAALRAALTQLVDAGLNMVRVGGTMVYESDDFYALCDELGILVWQDFMFANMDYPEQDAGFRESTHREVAELLERLQGKACLAVFCGDSEGEQQAAMWGAPREAWARPFFRETLRSWAAEGRPDVPYWPSSASGGAFPHQPSQGTASYYGVGAYLRPLEDARVSRVRFASECLAFANVPETATLEAWGGGQVPRVHTPTWKARTPRDLGAGWDFDDIRDHYVARLFGIDPATLRYADHERYLELGRVAAGEAMAATFGSWRRADSVCGGGLVWFLRDLWAGAGWGLVDAHGRPKAVYHFVRRACAPLAVHLSDEGLDGYRVDVVNDRATPFVGELSVELFRAGDVKVGAGRRPLSLGGHAVMASNVTELLEGFQDLSFAYRFGPPTCDVVVASVLDAAGRVMSQSFAFPTGRPATRERDLGLSATGTVEGEGVYQLVVESRRFAFAVMVDGLGTGPSADADLSIDDQYFHLAPGQRKVLSVRSRGTSPSAPPRLTVRALNAEVAARVSWA